MTVIPEFARVASRFYLFDDADCLLQQMKSEDQKFEDWRKDLRAGPGCLHSQDFEDAERIKEDILRLEHKWLSALPVLWRVWKAKKSPYRSYIYNGSKNAFDRKRAFTLSLDA